MPTPNEALRALFSRDENGCYWHGAFNDLLSGVRHSDLDPSLEARAREQETGRRRQISRSLNFAHDDVWACFGLIARLDWMRSLTTSGALSSTHFAAWATLDIENFHAQLLSAYDYAAKAILHAERVWNVHGKEKHSFEKARTAIVDGKWLGFEDDLASLFESASGFAMLRRVRNGIVHEGAHAMVFPDLSNGIRFQVFDAAGQSLESHGAMERRTIAFERYAVQTLGEFVLLLERLAPAVNARYPTQGVGGNHTRSYSIGVEQFVAWAKAAPHLPGEPRLGQKQAMALEEL